MSLFQIILISLLQGITEWLPISSSGHVLLASSYFGFGAHDELLINAMAHLGTLFAVLLFFWKDVLRAFGGGFELVGSVATRRPLSSNARLAMLILLSMPITLVVVGGFEVLASDELKETMRGPLTVAATTLVFGLALWWADVRGGNEKATEEMTPMHAVLIGATQAIAAILPGTSRSGITMTAARWFGYERTEAARFSMLIGAPILAATGAYAVLELLTAETTGVANLTDGLIVAGMSFVSGIVSIWALMEILKKMSFLPFVIYRIVLAIALVLASPLAFNWIAA
ncbi:undecaprenyl-diphosphate phosphatase [Ponticaulis sp.]|uniref:undecaprenyl-diphosphate phosphatase n=1 Tax=Ponticaulis sp. TaxID=2020902 RepID=UPI000B75DFD0|nr:undecaprenyl-diphosphate phosphatase [Ponticaulis sp.]MAI91663.1 UDP-diphosphatase [Ponticaulis sp.]OUX97228.1 MAG: UDP-diphosphatase [Hyphomonadaceae bacterium TMED5]|tara:strand:- start:56994 stop:57851 length:858 start_codon:yes stop_codon:yes gene_type:complete